MPGNGTHRRSVLRTTGATLAAVSSGALVGNVAAYGEPEVRTEYSTVSGDQVTTYGILDSTGDDTSADCWFDWGPEGDGLPYDSCLHTLSAMGGFCDGYSSDCSMNTYGSLDPDTYEYRAVASNDHGVATGSIKTFTIY